MTNISAHVAKSAEEQRFYDSRGNKSKLNNFPPPPSPPPLPFAPLRFPSPFLFHLQAFTHPRLLSSLQAPILRGRTRLSSVASPRRSPTSFTLSTTSSSQLPVVSQGKIGSSFGKKPAGMALILTLTLLVLDLEGRGRERSCSRRRGENAPS